MTTEALSAFLANNRGGVSVDEGLALSRYAADCAGGDIVETGDNLGKSAVALGVGALRSAVQVYCVDPHEQFNGLHGGMGGPRDRGEFYRLMLETGLFEQVALINLSSRHAARAWRKPLGMLLLAGGENYRAAKAEFDAWDAYLCMGGVVALKEFSDPARGFPDLISDLTQFGRFAVIGSVGRLRFLRKISSAVSAQFPDKKRILVASQGLHPARDVGIVDRLARILALRGHETAFLNLDGGNGLTGITDIPILGWPAVADHYWDVVIIPATDFPHDSMNQLGEFLQPQFGLRVQLLLDELTPMSALIALNRALKPHIVVINNQVLPPGGYTKLLAKRFHMVEWSLEAVESSATNLLRLLDVVDPSVHYTWAPELGLYGKWPLPMRLQGLEPILKTCAGLTILDLGSGDGVIAKAFLEHGAARVHGVELDSTRVAGARAICHAHSASRFWVMDFSDWEEFRVALRARGDFAYDIVLSLGVHHHLPAKGRIACLLGAAALARARFVFRTPEYLFKQDDVTALLGSHGLSLEYTDVDRDDIISPLRCYRRHPKPAAAQPVRQ